MDAPSRFKEWFNSLNPETENLPLEWKALKDLPFQKLLVLRCLRPDRISIALVNFIKRVLPDGEAFTELDQVNSFAYILEDTFKAVENDPSIPIFFVLSKGSDPTADVIAFGDKLGFSEANKKYFQISLGAEMEEQAIAKLTQSFKEGLWLMLQNIHLMPKFLTDLEKQLEKISQNIGAGNP